MKKSFVKKLKRNRGVIALALCAVLVLGAVVGILLGLRSCGRDPSVPEPETTTASASTGETTSAPVSQSEADSETAASTEPGSTSASGQHQASTEPSSETAFSEQTSASESAAATSAATTYTTPPPVTVASMANADTERWLAAAALVGVSMEYPDFELRGIYLASATALEKKAESKGAVIIFASGGEEMAVHAVPIGAERNSAGTRDISSEVVGFATFDGVSAASVDVSGMTEVDVDELEELIGQSLLISVYTH